MNHLSFLLYAGDVLANISGALTALAIVAITAVTVFVAARLIWYGVSNADDDLPRDFDASRFHARNWKAGKMFAWPLALFVIIGFIPSKTTFYLIAASEVGEDILAQPDIAATAGHLFDLVNAKIEAELTSIATPTE